MDRSWWDFVWYVFGPTRPAEISTVYAPNRHMGSPKFRLLVKKKFKIFEDLILMVSVLCTKHQNMMKTIREQSLDIFEVVWYDYHENQKTKKTFLNFDRGVYFFYFLFFGENFNLARKSSLNENQKQKKSKKIKFKKQKVLVRFWKQKVTFFVFFDFSFSKPY